MHFIDILIFILYLFVMLGVGFYFLKKNKSTEDYFVGGRQMSSLHIGLSVVATDVGGGFSIGLGGLGFVMGLSGSWLLFTGLVGAWVSGVFLIPKVFDLALKKGFLSFPQYLEHVFDKRVAMLAGVISAIGYLGFTSSQILAGAKLASSTFEGLSLQNALLVMGAIAIVYTAIGGIKAVIYTDTIQWLILMAGLIFVALPFAYVKLGGALTIRETLAHEFLTLTNVSWQQIVNWMFTIIPIWFVGMTLYQRIYASKDQKTAQKGWLIAGLFEYPVMAFIGVILGMLGRVAIQNGLVEGYTLVNTDAEMGLPLLLKTILPVGLLGIVFSAYFSAIMSTADSCLMASSANLLTDVLNKHNSVRSLRYSQILTFVIGVLALFLALKMENVLELMLLSYSFMVSGMIIPVMVALIAKNPNAVAALIAMISGGASTLVLKITGTGLPFELDCNIAGILISLLIYLATDFLYKK
ncbi:MAG: sodium:solute symporter family protein [Bacteroidales bacterium]|nr:sodium:solute symporter family protein [Bacteroidales bacterium]MBN2819596.1 sodium:solute symporter family protein [Bacteroidales bacterium]